VVSPFQQKPGPTVASERFSRLADARAKISPVSTPRDFALAYAIAEQIGVPASGCREIIGQGTVNHVFVAATAEGELVVRFHRDPLDVDDYAGEEWCLKSLKGEVPVPNCVAVGACQGISFIVQTFEEGENADGRRSPELWRTLGRYAKTINETPLDASAPESLFPRFGRDLLCNWHRHIDYNLAELTPADELLKIGAYEMKHQDELKRAFSNLRHRVTRFGLTHGDLVPKNVLLPPCSPPVVIDWGSAGTGAAPFHDYMRIRQDEAEEAFTDDDLEQFAAGYGSPVRELASTMDDLSLLGKIDKVRWAIDKRPDRVKPSTARAREEVLRRFG